MTIHRIARALASAVSSIVIAGCSQPATAPQTTLAPSSPAAWSTTPSPALSPSSVETLDAVDQIKLVAQAEAFMRSLIRPAASRAVWWAGVHPYLTATAAEKLASLEPSRVGFTQISGSGELVPESSRDRITRARTVAVPTDAGRFTVELTDPAGLRLVTAFGPEGGASPAPSTDAPSTDDGALKQFAVTFMEAFAKPAAGVSARQWWERIASMLTDDAIDTYADITPDAVPVRRVTGPVKIDPLDELEESDDIRAVTVGTDAGNYRLIIQPPTAGLTDRYLVIEIQEP